MSTKTTIRVHQIANYLQQYSRPTTYMLELCNKNHLIKPTVFCRCFGFFLLLRPTPDFRKRFHISRRGRDEHDDKGVVSMSWSSTHRWFEFRTCHFDEAHKHGMPMLRYFRRFFRCLGFFNFSFILLTPITSDYFPLRICFAENEIWM